MDDIYVWFFFFFIIEFYGYVILKVFDRDEFLWRLDSCKNGVDCIWDMFVDFVIFYVCSLFLGKRRRGCFGYFVGYFGVI